MRRGLHVLLGVLLVPTVGFVGDVVTDGKFKSTMSSGAPLEVTSTDMVVNLNADMVDGVEGTNIYTKAEVDALVAAAAAADSRRAYYLTTAVNDGSSALTACAPGFHMASFYEISDMSNLRYDSGLGMTNSDSGNGPPHSFFGWVRTGHGASTSSERGVGNCDVWNSASASDYGTHAGLSENWANPMLWSTGTTTCNLTLRVWCVED